MLVPEFSYYVDLGLRFLKLLVLLSFPVICYVVRRKWEVAVAREVEIRRLMALAAAEEEAAEVGYYAGGSVNRAAFELRGAGEVEAARAEKEEAVKAGYSADGTLNRVAFGFRGEGEVEAAKAGYYADVNANRAAVGFRHEGEVEEGSFRFCPNVAAHAEVVLKNVEAYKCAVCLSPTKARCSHCKSVWYCSTRCQIFHWWEGHRDTCYPPSSILTQSSNAESHHPSKTPNQEKEVPLTDPVVSEDRLLNSSCAHFAGSVFCSIGQTEQLNENNGTINTKVLKEVKPSVSTVSFSTAFSSDASLSSATSYSSDDPSTTESSSSSDLEKSNGCQHDYTFNQSKSVTQLANEIKPCASDGSITGPSKLKTQLASTQHDNQKTACSTPILRTESCEPLFSKSGPPDFWEGALDSEWTKPVDTKSRAKNDYLSDIGSSLSRPSDFRENLDDSCHENGKMHGSFSVINEPSHESVSSKKIDLSSSEVGIPVPLNSNIPARAKDVDNCVLNIYGDYNSISSSSATILSPPGVESPDNAQKVSLSPPLSTIKADHTISGAYLISNNGRSSASNADGTVKAVNVCQDYVVSHSQSAKRSSLSAERHGCALNSYECTKQSLKSKLVGSLPSNSLGTLTYKDSGGKVASHATNVNVVTSNNNVATSDSAYSRKVATGLKKSTQKAVDPFQDSKISRHCRAEEKDGMDVFSYELFKSLYGWNRIELQPCGLVNCANSCYANAVLQCLAFTPPLTAYLLEGLHSRNCNKIDWCFTCEFEKLILKAKDAKSPISPNGIISQIQNIGSHLSYGREEDAHEFLRCVVDTMQSICLKEGVSKITSNVEGEITLLSLTFGGYLQSKIRCLKCGNKSERSERIMDLSVEIEGSIQSLEDALKRFTSSETLDGENKYNCDRCKSYQTARKKLSVLEAPNILTIALKRFQAGTYGKLSKWIDFPQILNMAPYMSGKSDDKAPVYDLYGVIVHLDTMNAAFSGHYVCYIKNIQKKWFKIDDSVVEISDFGEVKKQSAYMLLYARCLPKAPRRPRDKLIANSKPTPPLTRHSPVTPKPKSPNFDSITRIEAYSNRHSVKFETDSYSNNISLSSSCSDKNSGSTDISARESNGSDGLLDLIFGDSGQGLRYPLNSSSNLDSNSPSVSPL